MTVPQKIAEASPVVTVPAWLVSLAHDVAPIVNLIVGVLTGISIIVHLYFRIRDDKKKGG